MFHLPFVLVSDELICFYRITHLGAEVTLLLSPNDPIVRESVHFVLEDQSVTIISGPNVTTPPLACVTYDNSQWQGRSDGDIVWQPT